MSAQRPLFDPDRMHGPEKIRPTAQTLTVSQLNAMVRLVLSEELPSSLHVVGEISNLSPSASGHLYLTLKDPRSELRCVMWRSAAASLKFKPADGLKVIATGYVDIYAPRGQYQFCIRRLEPRGAGALELAFRQLKERLQREGLFDPARKRPIPRYPRHIGLVTSASGAAVRDILKTLHRRYPCVHVTLHPVRVQGEGAAENIAHAVSRLNDIAAQLGGIDLLIVGRGGGSLEDLWAFNEEIVARAIAASQIPVISAVGHEVDVSIADLVADLRAPTPTAGAELAVPVLEDVLDQLTEWAARLHRATRHRLDMDRASLDALARTPWLRDPMTLIQYAARPLDELAARLQLGTIRRMNRAQTRLADTAHRLSRTARMRHLPADRQHVLHLESLLLRALRARFQSSRQRLDHLEARLEAGSYHRTLARGFTITRKHSDKSIVTSTRQAQPGECIITQTADGAFTSQVTDDSPNTKP